MNRGLFFSTTHLIAPTPQRRYQRMGFHGGIWCVGLELRRQLPQYVFLYLNCFYYSTWCFFFTRLHVQTMITTIRSKRPPHWHPYPNDDEQGLKTHLCFESLVLFFNSSHISMAVGGRQWDLMDGAGDAGISSPFSKCFFFFFALLLLLF